MDNRLEKLFLSFLKGTTSREEESELLESIETDRNILSEFKRLESAEAENIKPSFEQRMSFASLEKKMRRRNFRRGFYRVAPVLASAAAIVIAVLTGHNRSLPENGEQSMITISTAVGERKAIALPDGTKVTLNSATTLSYNGDYSRNRKVALSGEAYFEVVSDLHNPFTVDVKNSSIKVLGTKFNVAAYERENMLQATLVEGKIQFLNDGATMDMVPGEVLTCKSNSISKHKDDVSNYLSWMEGKLVYDRITLDDLLSRLSSCYGVQIVYSPIKYADYTFRISLNTNESIDAILDAVSILTPIQWSHIDGYISVKEK